MKKAIPLLALLLALGGWVLLVLTFANVLSGPLEDRICQTSCVQTYFFAGIAAGGIAFALGFIAMLRAETRTLPGYASLALAVPLCGVFGALIVIGNFA